MASGIWTDLTALAVTDCKSLTAGKDKYGKGQHGMALLSEKWIGFCLGQGIGKESVRSGQARCFGFPRQQSEASWPILLSMELYHGFCIPKVDLCLFSKTFFSSAVSVHSHGPSSLFRADGCSQSPLSTGRVWK